MIQKIKKYDLIQKIKKMMKNKSKNVKKMMENKSKNHKKMTGDVVKNEGNRISHTLRRRCPTGRNLRRRFRWGRTARSCRRLKQFLLTSEFTSPPGPWNAFFDTIAVAAGGRGQSRDPNGWDALGPAPATGICPEMGPQSPNFAGPSDLRLDLCQTSGSTRPKNVG